MLSKLPKELRERIYYFGFYYPMSSLGLLRVNRLVREEVLPVAYSKTTFRMEDIDDVVKLLIAIGETGRNNIKSLEFRWQSKSDLECQPAQSGTTECPFALPTLHVTTCIRLLEQCKSIKFICILFDNVIFSDINSRDYKSVAGIRELSSIRGIERLDIRDLSNEPLV
jgi:hypothetical protein